MARTQGSHSGITGPKVRAAARTLFAKHGYAAVSMRQIAAEVGVQAGALYNYTPDKQTLLYDLMKSHMDELLHAYDTETETDDPVRQLDQFVRFHIRYHSERPDAVFIAYMELRNLSAENFAIIEHLRREYEARLIRILEGGVEQKAFEVTDSRIAAMAVIAMLNGVNTWFREGGRLSMSDVEDLYCGMVQRSVAR
jgi:AcrR family transcriptional regulator